MSSIVGVHALGPDATGEQQQGPGRQRDEMGRETGAESNQRADGDGTRFPEEWPEHMEAPTRRGGT